MKSLKELLEGIKERYKSIFEQRYNLNSFWITPRGEFIDIDTHHYNWVLLNYDRFDFDILRKLELDGDTAKEYGEGDWEDIPLNVREIIKEDIFPKVFRNGWVRGGYMKVVDGEIVFELLESRISGSFLDNVLDIIKKVFGNPENNLEVEFEVYSGGEKKNTSMRYEDFLYIESKKSLMRELDKPW